MSAFMEALPNLALMLGVLALVLVALLVGDHHGQRREDERTMRCRVKVQHRNREVTQVTCCTHEVSWDARVRGWLCPNRSTLVVGRRVQP